MLFVFSGFAFPLLTQFWWLASLCLHDSSQLLLLANWNSLFFFLLFLLSLHASSSLFCGQTHTPVRFPLACRLEFCWHM